MQANPSFGPRPVDDLEALNPNHLVRTEAQIEIMSEPAMRSPRIQETNKPNRSKRINQLFYVFKGQTLSSSELFDDMVKKRMIVMKEGGFCEGKEEMKGYEEALSDIGED
ncbi:hypothetical protein ElyMa_002584700 [Elysia marginata]|uniref:Uncharacterized protein n=1 Tax=Elysia marginata TaxID=1093978 RepID=A0AAV4H3I4_9GAST|nr:hypothetical protein ElyMa_002584700 [Elysia marginata]